MNTNMKIFLKEDKCLSTLYIDMVFVEAKRPILFSCKDTSENLFICSCHCANGDKCEWILAPTTAAKIVDLITDKVTIRDMFDGEKELFITTLYAGDSVPQTKKVPIQDVPNDILPTAGFYMDVEENEFEEEIAELYERMRYPFEVAHVKNNFFVSAQSVFVNMVIPHIDIKKSLDFFQENVKFGLVVGGVNK